MPEQIDSNIGDSGNKLSGGQKQRLSIARAVLKPSYSGFRWSNFCSR